MAERTCLAVVLAAGEGTRMRSSQPKVLHAIGGETLLSHVLRAVGQAGAKAVRLLLARIMMPWPRKPCALSPMRKRRGRCSGSEQRMPCWPRVRVLERGFDDILIVFADTPLVRAQTLQRLRDALKDGAAVAVAGFTPADPTGYGRLIVKDGQLVAIREQNDASEAERAIRLCNGGLMALDGRHALALLDRIDDNNAKKEFYLTDAVALATQVRLARRRR